MAAIHTKGSNLSAVVELGDNSDGQNGRNEDGTVQDALDMNRMGKKQQLKVNAACPNDRNVAMILSVLHSAALYEDPFGSASLDGIWEYMLLGSVAQRTDMVSSTSFLSSAF